MTADSPKFGERASLDGGKAISRAGGHGITTDRRMAPSVDLAPDPLDELPGAPEAGPEARELERLRTIEAAAREVYKSLRLMSMQHFPQATYLAAALAITTERPLQEEDPA